MKEYKEILVPRFIFLLRLYPTLFHSLKHFEKFKQYILSIYFMPDPLKFLRYLGEQEDQSPNSEEVWIPAPGTYKQ